MIIDEQLFTLEDQCDELTETILSSETIDGFQQMKRRMKQCPEVSELAQVFAVAKADFEKIEGYGVHAPDYKEKHRALRLAKRKLDLNEKVADFRSAETSLQQLLDEIALKIAKSVSQDIKVDAGNPFFEAKAHSGCGGNCHAN